MIAAKARVLRVDESLLTGESTPVDLFFLAVALAFSAIPAGLLVAITGALSKASSRMADHNVVVRCLAGLQAGEDAEVSGAGDEFQGEFRVAGKLKTRYKVVRMPVPAL